MFAGWFLRARRRSIPTSTPEAGTRRAFIVGAGLVALNDLALRSRLRRREDGWRRAAGLVLRGENATFVLSAFGLSVWSDIAERAIRSAEESTAHLSGRLHDFLKQESWAHVCVEHGPDEDFAAPCAGPSYTLGFEQAPEGPARFVPPASWGGESRCPRSQDAAALPLLNFVGRVDRDGSADLWVRVNHVGADGAPAQEAMTRLERAWGVSERLLFPTPQEFDPSIAVRPCGGRSELVESQAFIDFSSLLAWRRRENDRLTEPMTFGAALLWRLSHHGAFAGRRMGTTVEVAARSHLKRGVGVVVVRPEDYFRRTDGLRRYVQDFNRNVERTRLRRAPGCRTLDAAALIPARLERVLLERALSGDRAFGSLGWTTLKDAKVFGAPIGDVGHTDGFFAIGSVGLPSAEGRSVGCVTMKGNPVKVAGYPRAIEEAIE